MAVNPQANNWSKFREQETVERSSQTQMRNLCHSSSSFSGTIENEVVGCGKLN